MCIFCSCESKNDACATCKIALSRELLALKVQYANYEKYGSYSKKSISGMRKGYPARKHVDKINNV